MSIGKLLRDATLAAVPARGGRPNVESYSGRHRHGSADGGDGCPRTGYGLSVISYRITTYDSSRRLTVWPTSRLLPDSRLTDFRLALLAHPLAVAALGPHPGGRIGVCFGVEDVLVAKWRRFPGRADELEESVGPRGIDGVRVEIRLTFSHPQHVGPGLPVAVGGGVDDAHDLLARVFRVSV